MVLVVPSLPCTGESMRLGYDAPMPNPTQEKIVAAVKRGVPEGGRVLELSCGEGHVLRTLCDAGYDVRGTNYSDHGTPPQGIDVDQGVDLLDSLPYDDGSFDCVILMEAIEHLSDHVAAIRNMSRVLSCGGLLIITTPNILRISSRVHFLLTGFYKPKRSFIGFDVTANQAFAFHNHCAHLPTLLYHLHSHGVAFEAIEAICYKAKSVVLWVLFAPLIVPFTWFETHVAQRNLRGTQAATLLFRQLASFKSLCGDSWLLMGRKQATGPVVDLKSRMPEWATPVSS